MPSIINWKEQLRIKHPKHTNLCQTQAAAARTSVLIVKDILFWIQQEKIDTMSGFYCCIPIRNIHPSLYLVIIVTETDGKSPIVPLSPEMEDHPIGTPAVVTAV